MIQTWNDKQRRGFSYWLRTGRVPRFRSPDGVECKFNPWHDPEDGRFTYAGTGQHFGREEAAARDGVRKAVPTDLAAEREPRIVFRDDLAQPRIKTTTEASAWRAKNLAKFGGRPDNRRKIEARYQQYLAALNPPSANLATPPATSAFGSGDRPNRVAEFATGVGEGVYGTATDAAKGVYSAATTNPTTTINNIEHGVADMIDRAMAAEEIPAQVQLFRAGNAVANASARDVGRAVGSVATNIALTIAPGAAATKVSALRHARVARSRLVYDPPSPIWVKENLGPDSPARRYNDSATGARPGQAPALERKLPSGATKLVKFDGIDGDYMIDRKTDIRWTRKFKDQTLRQSDVLAQHKLVAVWEFPTKSIQLDAIRLLNSVGVKNIKTRVVKP